MQNKKKRLFYIWSFSLGGGAEKILATIANNLDPDRYDIDVLEMEHYDKGFPKLREGIRVLKPYKVRKHSRIMEAFLWRLRFWCPNLVRKKLIKDEYDVEISFTIMNPPLPFSKRNEVKKIAWIHGSIENMPENETYYKLHGEHLGTADYIVAISKKTRDSIEQAFPEYKNKIVTIYNGYNFEELRKKAKEDCSEKIEEKSICCIGRLEELKGTERTLNLFKALYDKGYKYHLYYIGTGEQETKLRSKVKEWKLMDYVHFLGYQNNPYKYLGRMKMLVTMSLQEGFSGACVEALSLGKPFVSTDVGGAEELSQNGKFGKIIFDDAEALEAIITYMEDKCEVDNEERSAFIEGFTVESQMQAIKNILSV